MSTRICLVHYHEIGLKGRNRSTFERRLLDNLKAALSSFDDCEVTRISGHILATVEGSASLPRVAEIIAASPGVVKVSIGWCVGREMHEILKAAKRALFDCGPFETFKVAARRSNTDYPIGSMELNQIVGTSLCEAAPDKKVQMKNPDVTVHVQVSQANTFVFARSIPGVGGLPVGSAGKVVSLLSAGIDSPVSTWKMMRRGAVALCLHFSGKPQTSDASEHLVKEILETLAPCAGVGRLYVVPFGDYQREISLVCPPSLRIIIYRRLMFAVAQRIAEIEGAEALVTGESLGQVASQTLTNIRATDDAVDMPVLRPLIGSDKQEIIALAQKLGTFDISIQNQSDCCTLFMPRNPETHANLNAVREAWKIIPVEDWIEQIVRDVEIYDFNCPSYRPPKKKR